MSVPRTFNSETERHTLIVRPLRSIGSLAEENVKPELDSILKQVQDLDLKNAVIDLAEIPYFGTSMLEAMYTIWRHVRDKEGKMAVCNASKMGREILRVSRFDTLWPVYATRDEALDALGQ